MNLLRLIAFLALLVISISASAIDSDRQVLITYPQDTTSTYLAEAKTRLEAAVCSAMCSLGCLFPTKCVRLWLT